jgi:hypothetical protein
MAITAAILEAGQLGNSAAATLYAVPSSALAYITSIKLTNTDAAPRTYNICVKKSGGTARHLAGKDVSLAAGATIELLDDPQRLRLNAADEICGDADSASKVDWVISGVVVQ